MAAAARFGHRPPEVLAGYDRDSVGGPAEYPTACSPQAWSSAAFLLAVRLLLGLTPPDEPDEPPCLPEGVANIYLTAPRRVVN